MFPSMARLGKAMNQLGYAQDRKVLRRFMKYPVDTKTVLIVRHGTAGSRSKFKGDDRLRPLDKHGRAQAESLVGVLLAFGADTTRVEHVKLGVLSGSLLAALLAAVLLRARNRVYRRLCEAEERDSDHDGTPDVYEGVG